MAIELIDKIKPKNGGSFPLVEAADVEMPDGKRLDQIAGKIKDENSGAAIRVWFGTEAAYEALESAGLVEDDVWYNILEDDVST
jgi:hypothetical protein